MSDLNQIHAALARLFHEEGQRIVFWNDPEREFQNTLPFLMLDGVTVLRLDEVGALETKIRLERDEPDGKFLLYSPTARTRRRTRLAARHPALQSPLPGGSGEYPAPGVRVGPPAPANPPGCTPRVLRRQGPAAQAQKPGRPGGCRRRPRPQDDRRGRQGRPAGTLQPRSHPVPRLDSGISHGHTRKKHGKRKKRGKWFFFRVLSVSFRGRNRSGCAPRRLGADGEVRPRRSVLVDDQSGLWLRGRTANAEKLPAAAAARRLRPSSEGRRAALAPGSALAPQRSRQRRGVPGAVAGFQQPGRQLRPALGGSGGDSEARRAPGRSRNRRPDRRDDLPGR